MAAKPKTFSAIQSPQVHVKRSAGNTFARRSRTTSLSVDQSDNKLVSRRDRNAGRVNVPENKLIPEDSYVTGHATLDWRITWPHAAGKSVAFLVGGVLVLVTLYSGLLSTGRIYDLIFPFFGKINPIELLNVPDLWAGNTFFLTLQMFVLWIVICGIVQQVNIRIEKHLPSVYTTREALWYKPKGVHAKAFPISLILNAVCERETYVLGIGEIELKIWGARPIKLPPIYQAKDFAQKLSDYKRPKSFFEGNESEDENEN